MRGIVQIKATKHENSNKSIFMLLYNIHNRLSFIWGCVFPVSILKYRWYTHIFPNAQLYFTEFRIIFFKILTKVAAAKTIWKCLYWNLRKKWWEISVAVTSFSNDESKRPPTLVKTESITAILIDLVPKFQNSYF